MNRWLIILPAALLASLSATVSVDAAEVSYFPQVGDGAFSTIRFQTSIILVNTGASSPVRLEFFDSAGQPMEVELPGLGTASQFEFELERGAAFSARTPGTGPLRVGYARLTAQNGVGGTAVFTRIDVPTGTVLYEAGVPASRSLNSFSLFLDAGGPLNTGLAMVNPPGTEESPGGQANVVLRLHDLGFNQIATTNVPLGEGWHRPQFINEFFSAVPQARQMQGTVVVESDRPIAAVTLRQNDDPNRPYPQSVPALTAFPVVPGAATTSPAGSFSVLAGSRVAVTLDLRNADKPVTGVILRFSHAGTPLHTELRPTLGNALLSEVIELPEGSREPDRVEVRIVYADGEVGPPLALE
ncbi:MAG: hypothetical protein Kow001_10400 [Acidobacteriota bacterium]